LRATVRQVSDAPDPPRVAVFAPHPLVTVTLEREGADRERVHFHGGGQGVWVAQMLAALGADPILCGFAGGETGVLLEALLARALPQPRLVPTAAASGCYVTDRRGGEREVIVSALTEPPTRHELDELVSLTCAEAIAAGWLIVTNPMPADALPLEVYGELVADARSAGCTTAVDLSSPRLDGALGGEPDLVKLNDWELAEFVHGPVDEVADLLRAAEQLRERGARSVLVTRGELPALALVEQRAWWLTPPALERGFREGCGDAMLGALVATWARTGELERAIVVGAAAGAANFLRRGLGGASGAVVERLVESVRLEPFTAEGAGGGRP
jgi:1-phosphofructokinase